MTLITDSKTLAAHCEKLSREQFVAVDTEFMRERTYYPILCLVQIAGAEDAVAIDTLAEGIDLAPLLDLMANPGVLKVFHACRQDMEIFFYLMSGLTGEGVATNIPAPVFDTQIGAMVCGHGDSISYDKLVRKLTGVQIDKTSRFTDWSHRPLSSAQLGYALSDVIHLRPVYEKIAAQIEEANRHPWLAEEIAIITDPATYDIDPNDVWRRLKIKTGKPRFLAILREVAAWRERTARRRDVPRNRILRDDIVADIAARAPVSAKDIGKIRTLSSQFAAGRAGEEILAAVARGRAVPEADCPDLPPTTRSKGSPGTALVDLLRVLLKAKAEQNDVAAKLIANADDLDAIALNDEADVPALRGWRREVFGNDALALKRGALALSATGERIKLIQL